MGGPLKGLLCVNRIDSTYILHIYHVTRRLRLHVHICIVIL